MSRMMPGRLRQEGIELYERGQLSLEKIEGQQLLLRIGEVDFQYGLENGEVSCTCELFSQKGYCQHLAATEYFLKNDAEGKELIKTAQAAEKKEQETRQRNDQGSLFLENLLGNLEVKHLKYRLSTEASLGSFEKQIDWTLKISRLPDQRNYVIRDISAFLKVLRQGGYYQIGKNYYEPIFYEEFDQASRELIDFLWRVFPEKSVTHQDILVNMGRNLRLPLLYFEEGLELLQNLSSFQFQYQMKAYQEVQVLPYDSEIGIFRFDVTAHTHWIELAMEQQYAHLLLGGHYLIKENHLYSLNRKERTLLESLDEWPETETGFKRIQIHYQDQDKLALVLSELRQLGSVKAPKKFVIHDFQASFHLTLQSHQMHLKTSLSFDGIQVGSQAELEQLPFLPHYQHLQHLFATIEDLGFYGRFEARQDSLKEAEQYRFLTEGLARLRAMGRLTMSEEVAELLIESPTHISVKKTGSLLDISFDFSGIATDEIEAATQVLLNQEAYFASKTGRILVFDEESKIVSQSLQSLRARYGTGSQFTLSTVAGYQLAQVLEHYSQSHLAADFQQLAYDLTHPEAYPLPDITLQAALRDYQKVGIQWLSMLDRYGFGGILADDMGLGKTLQTIAFLSGHLEKNSRVLILTPASLMYNWQEEFQRFAPHLDVAVVYGHRQEREQILAQEHQVLVTSYTSFRQDIDLYHKKQQYDYLFLDEAQVMKNSQTKIAQYLREFSVGNSFALSGTPIENHLSEIWSIFQIILPGLLPNKTEFSKLTASEVARLVKPFVLRRKKEDVLQELPDLIEVNVWNELSDEQKAIYLAQLQQMQASIRHASLAEINRRKIEILSGITRLRQICDTPKLFIEDYRGGSGKLDSLRELLIQLKDGHHRVLIFSQYRNMLDLIEGELAELGVSSYKLTGSTPASQRQTMTRAFNAGSRDAFLISLKAGGVGLNLTGADAVILVDLWWNPAVEAQAISRAHRMGQTEKVEVYRLITRGSIEEKIQALQETKKNLVTTVLDGNESRASMTAQEIREILGIS